MAAGVGGEGVAGVTVTAEAGDPGRTVVAVVVVVEVTGAGAGAAVVTLVGAAADAGAGGGRDALDGGEAGLLATGAGAAGAVGPMKAGERERT